MKARSKIEVDFRIAKVPRLAEALTVLMLVGVVMVGVVRGYHYVTRKVPQAFNHRRALDMRLLTETLADYRRDFKKFPVLIGQPYSKLGEILIKNKFLRELPEDPTSPFGTPQYEYASDGESYGLLVWESGVGHEASHYCLVGQNVMHSPKWEAPPCNLRIAPTRR